MLISSQQFFSKTVDYYGNTAFKTMSLMIIAIMTLLVVLFYSWAFRCIRHFLSDGTSQSLKYLYSTTWIRGSVQT